MLRNPGKPGAMNPPVFLGFSKSMQLNKFGCVKACNIQCGRLGFIAPELLSSDSTSFNVNFYKSDIFSLGRTMYCLMSCTDGFDSDSEDEIDPSGDKLAYNRMFNSYSKPLKDVVKWMLESDPADRPSVHDMLELSLFDKDVIMSHVSKASIKFKRNIDDDDDDDDDSDSDEFLSAYTLSGVFARGEFKLKSRGSSRNKETRKGSRLLNCLKLKSPIGIFKRRSKKIDSIEQTQFFSKNSSRKGTVITNEINKPSAVCFSAREILFQLDNKLRKTYLGTEVDVDGRVDCFENSDIDNISIHSSPERIKNNQLVLQETRPKLICNLFDQEKVQKYIKNDGSDLSGDDANEFSRIPTIPDEEVGPKCTLTDANYRTISLKCSLHQR